MTAATAAFGVTLTRGGTAVAEIIEMGNIKFERDFIDVTNHASPGGYEEFIASAIIKTGELTFTCNSVPGNANGQAGIKSDWSAKTASNYGITFPDGTSFSGAAIVTSYEYIAVINEQIKFTCTLKWSGALTDNAALATAPSALAVTTATLYPTPFAADTYEYYGVSTADTCTITLTFLTSSAALYREGVFVQNLVTATPSGALSLGADGTVTDFEIKVTETSKGTRTYNLHISNATG